MNTSHPLNEHLFFENQNRILRMLFCEVGFLFFQICYLIHYIKKFQVESVQSLVIEKTNHF